LNIHLCMISTGNICRSPTAEAIFYSEVEKRGLTAQVNFVFFSTGNL